ncbi:MAG: MBL fold metallo-hydrolase [Bacteroidales bacterium]|nr:MBL fold metallo-hydrolase [Bacteroidales bacterium]
MDLFSSLYPFVFCSLASGSSGNSYYIGNGDEGLLIDAGISSRRIVKSLAENGISIRQVKAILATHDHSDHIKGLAVLANKYRLPVMATPDCLKGVSQHPLTAELDKDLMQEIRTRKAFRLSGLEITAFSVPHDGMGSVGYHVRNSHASLTLATDLGVLTDEAVHFLKSATTIVLESNYDEDLLQNGSYPPYLKQRIRSHQGHLSNADVAAFLQQHFHSGIQQIFLCHLSQHNNHPELARQSAIDALNGCTPDAAKMLTVLPRGQRSPLFHL